MNGREFLSHLRQIKPTGINSWTALCPGHGDKNRSLSIKETEGKILLKCFAGCESSAIVEALGLTLPDLFAEPARNGNSGSKNIVRVYDYTDENGSLLYQVCRYEPKDFRPRVKQADGSFKYSLEGVRRVLYRFPDILKADIVLIVEGEKDADNLVDLGFKATTSQGGANGWRVEYADHLTGKDVVIIPDADEPGRKYAETISRSLDGKAKSIRIVKLPSGKDISDWAQKLKAEGRSTEEIKTELDRFIELVPIWGTDPEYSPGIIHLHEVKPEMVSWLWRDRVPEGKITLLDGDPGLGKSTVSLDLAARVTTGKPMPDGTQGLLGGAVLLSMEDGLADTVVPRLVSAGADLSKIVALQSVPDVEGKPRFPTVEDIGAIRQAIERVQGRIVIIDPLMAHLNGRTNSWRDQDVRQALSPLAKMAEETGVAVIVIRHLNKSGGSQSVYRGGGSIGIIGAARVAWLIAKDPEDESRRIFAGIKNNLAQMPPSISFHIDGDGNGSRIVWGGESKHGADALLSIPSSPEERGALDEAKDFLRDQLSDGPVESKTILKNARSVGIADKTLQRAKKSLGVSAEKQGYVGGWVWVLNAEDGQEPLKVVTQNDDHLRPPLTAFDGKYLAPESAPETPPFSPPKDIIPPGTSFPGFDWEGVD